jgi:glycosyltransferase involved in cell wall biosynthesis
MKRLTVLMPVFNVEAYVVEAINSVLSQTYSDFDLLIIDDCSTDNTEKAVKTVCDNRIRYIRNESNLGLAENLNKGISLIDTELIARMDGDDISDPALFEKQIAVLDQNPEIGICSTCFRFFGTKNYSVKFPEFHDDVLAEMLFGNAVIVPMFRSRIFKQNNIKYSTTAFPAEDYMVWAECVRYTKIYNLQQELFFYRTHATQISTEKRLLQIDKTNNVRLYMLGFLNPDIDSDTANRFLQNLFDANFKSNEDINNYLLLSKELIYQNEKYSRFSKASLIKCMDRHFYNLIYNYVLKKYFSSGFSINSFFKYMHSGLFKHMPIKRSARFLFKSLS